mgnify:CR=1 FL=1
MTGYGKSVVTYKGKKINVEVKSLNSKALDLSTRIAPVYREKEMEIRKIITKKLLRGKVDFAIWVEKDAAVDATPVNAALVANYYRQISDIAVKGVKSATGISTPTTDTLDLSQPYTMYDLSGHRINNLGEAKGMVIIKQGGRSYKVMK